MFPEVKEAATENCSTAKSKCAPITHDGKIVSITGNKLVMSNKEGKECSHTVATDATLTCDGKSCKVEDLKVGHKIRVTTKKEDVAVATGIEQLNKNAEFSQCV